jgi:hypothetical protein
MIKFLFGYVLGHHREARSGCGVVLILFAAVIIAVGMMITGNA